MTATTSTLLRMTLLLAACAGSDRAGGPAMAGSGGDSGPTVAGAAGSAGGGGSGPRCGGCAIPRCETPSPCDCGCIPGDTFGAGTLLRVCTPEGCFAPAVPDAGGAIATGGAGSGAADDGGVSPGMADAAVDGGIGNVPVEPVDCAPVDVQTARVPAGGCRFELNVVVRRGYECQGHVALDGRSLRCNDEHGWRMPDASTLELQGDACATLQSSALSLVMVDFPCSVIADVL